MLSNIPVECPGYLLRKAKNLVPAKTAIVNAGAQLPLESARAATDEGLIEPILVGNSDSIKRAAEAIEWDISHLQTVNANSEIEAADTSVALARNREVSSLIKGDLHTDNLLRAVLNKETGLRTGRRLSHIFHMTLPGSDQALYITDAAINVLPSFEIKMDILRNAVELLHAMGNPLPKIALLSATETPIPSVPSSVEASNIVREAENDSTLKDALIDGPFAFDNAVSEEAARIKGVNSKVAGHADVLLVPNIETGNALFKQMVYFMSAAAAGIVMGAKVPIVLTSRADPVAARLAAIALAAIYSNTL